MSYTSSPQTAQGRAPVATDDSSAGFYVGAMWVDTSPATPVPYSCLNDAVGAAVWRRVGGVQVHNQLSGLTWLTAGHDGTANSVAAFNALNVAANYQPVAEGSVLSFNAAVLQWTSPPPSVVALSSRTNEIQYLSAASPVGGSAAVVTGEFNALLQGLIQGGDAAVVAGNFV